MYKNLKAQSPLKSAIANEFGLYSSKELSSWLEALSVLRNVIAHHSRLWYRIFSKKPMNIKGHRYGWLSNDMTENQRKRVFGVISCLVLPMRGRVILCGDSDTIIQIAVYENVHKRLFLLHSLLFINEAKSCIILSYHIIILWTSIRGKDLHGRKTFCTFASDFKNNLGKLETNKDETVQI